MQKPTPNYLTENKIRIFNKDGQEISPLAGQLELGRGDPLHVPPGSGRRLQLARLRAHQHPEPVRRLHARHALQGHLRRRFPLRLVGLRARAERARLHHLAAQGHARLEPRPDRRRRSSRGQRIDARLAAAGAASTGSTSPPGRRPTASCSSATTSTTRTASAPSRSPPTPPSSSRTTTSKRICMRRMRKGGAVASPFFVRTSGQAEGRLFSPRRCHPRRRAAPGKGKRRSRPPRPGTGRGSGEGEGVSPHPDLALLGHLLPVPRRRAAPSSPAARSAGKGIQRGLARGALRPALLDPLPAPAARRG